MDFIFIVLCLYGVNVALGMVGIDASNWQWWAIYFLICLYTVLLALID